MSEPEIVVVDDAAAVAAAGGDRVAEALRGSVAARGEAHFAVTGGSSPLGLYRLLAARGDVAWEAVHLWWSDERFVPPDHPESNDAAVRDTLLRADEVAVRGADVPAANVHPFPIAAALEAGHDADWAARAYADEILRHVPAPDGERPIFDVMLLGVGSDGHVMSAFPGSPALARDAPLALAVPAPRHVEPHLPRVTLRPRVADDARTLLVIVPDGAKADVVTRALEGPRDEAALPAQVARRAGATWLLSREAAAGLRRSGVPAASDAG